MAIATEYQNVPNILLARIVRDFQAENFKHGCLPDGLLEELAQRIEQLEDQLENQQEIYRDDD